MKTPSYASRLVAEVVGTFLFFFFGFMGIAAATEQGLAGTAVAASFGLGLALAIFAFGHISGGHYNPAVTLGLAAGQRFPWKEVPGYWFAQFIGGMCAAGLVNAVFGAKVQTALVNAPSAGVSDGKLFVLEAVATMFFVMVISAVATDARAPWHGVFAPLAIGGFIFTAAITVGSFTSGSFNPARSLAPAIYESAGDKLWIYLVAPAVGAVVGGALYWTIRHESGDK